jgi:hypothetical protein
MSGRIVISHSAPDAGLGADIAQFLQAMIDRAQVAAVALPPPGTDGEEGLVSVRQRLASADAVVGLVTRQALGSFELPFQLGVAWSLDKPLALLLGPDVGTPDLGVALGRAEALVLGPENLLELAESLARNAGLQAEMGGSAREVLARLFPDFSGLDRQSSERLVAAPRDDVSTQPLWPVNEHGEAVPPERLEPRAGLPNCGTSLQAGRAMSDCVFHRNAGGRFADELDRPFGAFLTSLGSDWTALRRLDDLDVWLEAAQNVLAGLGPAERHVRYFYEIGFQLSILINLAQAALEGEPGEAQARERWPSAWQALRKAALLARVAEAAVDRLQPMLENLYGPRAERDVANFGRVQECVQEFAAQADAAVLAASA